jgi:transcriptional regulator with XRE-family HTH domain
MESMTMNNRILEVREALGYGSDQDGFARLIGVSQATVSLWEAGKTMPTRTRLKAFERSGVNIDWLLTGDGEMFNEKAPSHDVAEIVRLYRQLTPDQQKILEAIAAQFLK